MMHIYSYIRSAAANAAAKFPLIARALSHDSKKPEPTRLGRMAKRAADSFCSVILFVVLSSSWGFSADIVLLRTAAGVSSEQREIELASQFYGLNLEVVTGRRQRCSPFT